MLWESGYSGVDDDRDDMDNTMAWLRNGKGTEAVTMGYLGGDTTRSDTPSGRTRVTDKGLTPRDVHDRVWASMGNNVGAGTTGGKYVI